MQGFSLAFGRVSRASFSANSELKAHVTDLVNRAHANVNGTPITSADPQWSKAIIASCMQLCMDPRTENMSTRELIQLFEHVLRISDEHLREARRHAAMATNVFYLKETSLDASLYEQSFSPDYAASTVIGGAKSSGRLAPAPDADA